VIEAIGDTKVLYYLKLSIFDKKINNPKSYLMKVFKDQYGLDFSVNAEYDVRYEQ
jgi:hypothetical protein